VQIVPEYAQALANRASAYQLLDRHDAALQDITRALLLDRKYAAAYCTQRGILQLTHERLDGAVADLTVALLLDPDNLAARAFHEEAMQRRDAHFELHVPTLSLEPAVAAPVPAPDRAVPAPEPDGSASKETQVRQRAVETQTQIEVPEETEAAEDEGGLIEDDVVIEAGPETEAGAADQEQRRAQALELQRQREHAEELRRTLEEARLKKEEAKKQKEARRKRRSPEEDEEEAAERRKKWKNGLILAAGLLVAVWYSWGWVKPALQRWLAPVRMPKMSAEQFASEYGANSQAADDKYADKRVILTGKVVIQVAKRGRAVVGQKIFFDLSDREEDPKWVECEFADPDEASVVSSGKEYRISGVVQPYSKDSGLRLKFASLMGNTS
jgi:tetratricopeptide (TPR) repeat protein